MTERNEDLHGNAPDTCSVALLLIDVINDLNFPEGDQVLEMAMPMARKLADLKKKAKEASVPVIYANDNFGRWRSDFTTLIEHCLEANCRGKPVVELLRPEADDYFVLKPKHSAFFRTTLDILLEYLDVEMLVLAGIAANICVLFTANDAYMRDFQILVPQDCVVANTELDTEHALAQMRQVLKADTRGSEQLRWQELLRSSGLKKHKNL
jgi:nicotinamidase-related amidase